MRKQHSYENIKMFASLVCQKMWPQVCHSQPLVATNDDDKLPLAMNVFAIYLTKLFASDGKLPINFCSKKLALVIMFSLVCQKLTANLSKACWKFAARSYFHNHANFCNIAATFF